MDNLKFRRQFLFTAIKCNQLENWKCKKMGKYYLYVHPDCESTIIKNNGVELALIGYAINPTSSNKSNFDILQDIMSLAEVNKVPEALYGLAGRFVLIINKEGQFSFFNDACGLRILFYTKLKEDIYVASQPLLLKLVTKINKGANYKEYFDSEYVKSNIEHLIPSGISLFDDVFQLVPNHYLDASEFKQIRYWPNKSIKNESLDDGVEKFANLLENTMIAANKRYKLALSLTAGWDTRIILSACKKIAKDLMFYTLQYRNLDENSYDISIPNKLLKSLGYKHHIIDTRKPLDEHFINIYKENTDIPHLNDWGVIANGMYSEFPQERIAIKGNCAEIGRCFYYTDGKHPVITSSEEILNLDYNWKNIGFVNEQITKWFEELKGVENIFGYNLLDLFYWEHRIGSWQAQSQLEWDIVQEVFTPFNNRELIDIMLSVEPKYRCKTGCSKTEYLFFRKTIKLLWSDVLNIPVAPKTIQEKIKDKLKRILMQMGLFYRIKRLFHYNS